MDGWDEPLNNIDTYIFVFGIIVCIIIVVRSLGSAYEIILKVQ